MKAYPRAVALFGLLLTLTSARGAELFEVPSGVMVRSLPDWEGVVSLEVKSGGNERLVPVENGVAEHLFSRLALCQGAAYRTDNGPWHDLSGYCHDKAETATSFLFISDSQQYHDEHRKTGKLIAALKSQHPELKFVVNGGDLVHFGLESEWKKYRAISTAEYSAQLPLVAVLGNHEFYLDFTLKNWQKLYGTVETQRRYFALDFPLFSLLVLDSNVGMMSAGEKKTQDAWIAAQLAARAGKKPILAVFHHAAFTSGRTQHMLPIPPHHIRKVWQPLFEKYGVRLVLNGHEHIYERLAVNGVQYLLAGPAGGVLSEPGETSPYSQLLEPSFRSVSMVTVDTKGHFLARTWSVETEKLVDEYQF